MSRTTLSQFIGNFALLVFWSTVWVIRSHMDHEDDLGGVPIHVLIMSNINVYFAFLLFALAEAYRQMGNWS